MKDFFSNFLKNMRAQNESAQPRTLYELIDALDLPLHEKSTFLLHLHPHVPELFQHGGLGPAVYAGAS